jgi:hypothetical protein
MSLPPSRRSKLIRSITSTNQPLSQSVTICNLNHLDTALSETESRKSPRRIKFHQAGPTGFSRMAPTTSSTAHSSFCRISGQQTTNWSSPTSSSLGIMSSLEPVLEKPQSDDDPFRSVFDTPRSSEIKVTGPAALEPLKRQVRLSRFVECGCIRGEACEGSGVTATCGLPADSERPNNQTKSESVEQIHLATKKSRMLIKLRKVWKSCAKVEAKG